MHVELSAPHKVIAGKNAQGSPTTNSLMVELTNPAGEDAAVSVAVYLNNNASLEVFEDGTIDYFVDGQHVHSEKWPSGE